MGRSGGRGEGTAVGGDGEGKRYKEQHSLSSSLFLFLPFLCTFAPPPALSPAPSVHTVSVCVSLSSSSSASLRLFSRPLPSLFLISPPQPVCLHFSFSLILCRLPFLPPFLLHARAHTHTHACMHKVSLLTSICQVIALCQTQCKRREATGRGHRWHGPHRSPRAGNPDALPRSAPPGLCTHGPVGHLPFSPTH